MIYYYLSPVGEMDGTDLLLRRDMKFFLPSFPLTICRRLQGDVGIDGSKELSNCQIVKAGLVNTVQATLLHTQGTLRSTHTVQPEGTSLHLTLHYATLHYTTLHYSYLGMYLTLPYLTLPYSILRSS